MGLFTLTFLSPVERLISKFHLELSLHSTFYKFLYYLINQFLNSPSKFNLKKFFFIYSFTFTICPIRTLGRIFSSYVNILVATPSGVSFSSFVRPTFCKFLYRLINQFLNLRYNVRIYIKLDEERKRRQRTYNSKLNFETGRLTTGFGKVRVKSGKIHTERECTRYRRVV